MREKISGSYGTAELVDSSSKTGALGAYLIHSPFGQAISAWQHWMIALVHLRDIEGVEPAKKSDPRAEYEIHLVAIDSGRLDTTKPMREWPLLKPINYAEQFFGLTEDEARDILDRMAAVFLNGILPLEPQGVRGARELFRSMVQVAKEEIRRQANDKAIDAAVREIKGESTE